MAEENSKDIGKFARHPLRTMGGAFLAGTAIGAGMAAGKNRHHRSGLHKFLDQIS